MPDSKHNLPTVTEWYRAGHFANEAQAMGAFKLAHQQAVDGMGANPADWMGMDPTEYRAWLERDELPPKGEESDELVERPVVDLMDLIRAKAARGEPIVIIEPHDPALKGAINEFAAELERSTQVIRLAPAMIR